MSSNDAVQSSAPSSSTDLAQTDETHAKDITDPVEASVATAAAPEDELWQIFNRFVEQQDYLPQDTTSNTTTGPVEASAVTTAVPETTQEVRRERTIPVPQRKQQSRSRSRSRDREQREQTRDRNNDDATDLPTRSRPSRFGPRQPRRRPQSDRRPHFRGNFFGVMPTPRQSECGNQGQRFTTGGG